MKTFLLAFTLATLAFTGASRAADEAPVKPYVLDTCIVGGEKLGSMGEPVTAVYSGQEIKFCCAGCKPEFDKDPAAGLKKYEATVAAKAAATE